MRRASDERLGLQRMNVLERAAETLAYKALGSIRRRVETECGDALARLMGPDTSSARTSVIRPY
jgi:hypothetical protein